MRQRKDDDPQAVIARDDARSIAENYMLRAGGDTRAALLQAVADGIATSRLVSRGYARWGPPAKRRRNT